MSGPLQVSVLMSVFNEPKEWIIQSVESILNQTFTDFEFIIICDNPKNDEVITLLNDYEAKDSRIRLIFNEENIGLTKSLNKGLAIAKGKYIARMDADDISMPDRLELQVCFLNEHPDVDVCGMAIQFKRYKRFINKTKIYPSQHKDICDYMLMDNPIAHPTVVFKRIVKGWNVRYDENVKKAQDYKLWYTLLQHKAIFCNSPQIGLKYRVSPQQISNKGVSSQHLIADEIRGQMLRAKGVDEERIRCFNECFNVTTTDIPLVEKLNCMLWIRANISNNNHVSNIVEKKLFEIWVYNCVAYRDYSALIKYPDKKQIISNVWLLLSVLIKNLL